MKHFDDGCDDIISYEGEDYIVEDTFVDDSGNTLYQVKDNDSMYCSKTFYDYEIDKKD